MDITEKITLAKYVQDNKKEFTKEVTLPNGRISLMMTKKGCQFLLSWIACFTIAFASGQSWNGMFTLDDFKFVEGHIRTDKKPKAKKANSMENDLTELVRHVEDIFCSEKPNLISKYPPYLRNLTHFLSNLIIPGHFSKEDKLFLETHVSCLTSCARERLIIRLYRKYESLNEEHTIEWNDAILHASCPVDWYNREVFVDIIARAEKDGRNYPESKNGAFRFIRDVVMHAGDHQDGEDVQMFQYGEGLELMTPANLENFLPIIIKNLIEKKVDISTELSEAIQCACTICDAETSES